MTINLQTGGYQMPQALPVSRSAEAQLPIRVASQPAEYQAPEIARSPKEAPTPSPEAARYEKVVVAAQNLFSGVFAVSDKNFTIFKDASGQYITRYTSLRDGRVTYIPEPKLMQLAELSRGQTTTIELQA